MPAAELTHVNWRKSSRSNGEGNQCVEIASLTGGAAAIRDSKDPASGAIMLASSTWDGLRAILRSN
jgi:hypothetical protein